MTTLEALRDHILRLEARITELEKAAKIDPDPTTMPPKMREVIHAHALKSRCTFQQLLGPSREAYISRSRRACWAELWEAGYSLQRIGMAFRRHHATVLAGIRRKDKKQNPDQREN